MYNLVLVYPQDCHRASLTVGGTTFETLIFTMLFIVKPTMLHGIYELAVQCYRLIVCHHLL